MNHVEMPVLIVRGRTLTIAVSMIVLRLLVERALRVSRIRSKTTTESLTVYPMIVRIAASHKPSMGLPVQAKTPTTTATVCTSASTAPAP